MQSCALIYSDMPVLQSQIYNHNIVLNVFYDSRKLVTLKSTHHTVIHALFNVAYSVFPQKNVLDVAENSAQLTPIYTDCSSYSFHLVPHLAKMAAHCLVSKLNL